MYAFNKYFVKIVQQTVYFHVVEMLKIHVHVHIYITFFH